MDVEQRARELLAAQCEIDGMPEAAERVRTGTFKGDAADGYQTTMRAIIAALRPPEGYVLVPVDVQNDAERYQWLKRCSREQYLLARGMFGLAEDAIDAVIRDESKETQDGH